METIKFRLTRKRCSEM